jgi:hypothetical protein
VMLINARRLDHVQLTCWESATSPSCTPPMKPCMKRKR